MSRLPGQKIRDRAQEYVRCPFHKDRKPSLSLNLDEGIWRCHGPCNVGGGLLDFELKLSGGSKKSAWAAIEAAMGIENSSASVASGADPEAIYPYLDGDGNLLYEAVRYPGKDFRQRRPDEHGGYICGRGNIEPVLYNLPELIGAKIALITEGEKDVETLIAALKLRERNDAGRGPFAATTNTGGADQWQPEYGKLFKDKRVYVFQDNDVAGRRHSGAVLRSVWKYTKKVKLINLPGLKDGEDVTDWLRDHTPHELIQAIKKSPWWHPEARPEASESADASSKTLREKIKELPPGALEVICLADVEPREVERLWEPYIPVGMLTMLSGDPEAGKTYIALAIAAQLSKGERLDGGECAPANTLYFTVENTPNEVLRRRFDMLGGDSSHLGHVKGSYTPIDGKEENRFFSLADLTRLEQAISYLRPKLVVVDPLQSYLGAAVDMNRSNETRPVLDGLTKLADRYRCAIVLIRHLTKQGGSKAINRGLGSIDFTGAARSELLAGSLPDYPDTRAMVHIKNNVGPHGPSKGYVITEAGEFYWQHGPCSITAAQLLVAPSGHHAPSKQDKAVEWLKEQLADGPRRVTELEQAAQEADIAWATVRRAQERLGVQPGKQGMKGPWMWSLPR
jgi:hypothetical protein